MDNLIKMTRFAVDDETVMVYFKNLDITVIGRFNEGPGLKMYLSDGVRIEGNLVSDILGLGDTVGREESLSGLVKLLQNKKSVTMNPFKKAIYPTSDYELYILDYLNTNSQKSS